MHFTMYLQVTMFTNTNSHASSVHLLLELYPLILHFPYVWLDGYLACAKTGGRKKNLCMFYTEQAKEAHFYDLLVG